MNSIVRDLIEKYKLKPLAVENTYYCQTYVSQEKDQNGIPAMTVMYGLYCNDPVSVSCFHRLSRDETWCFYEGDPIHLYLLYPDGSDKEVVLGADCSKGEVYQYTIPAGVWQGGCLDQAGTYALYGCIVAPGFTPDCFEAAVAGELSERYPKMECIIHKLNVNQGIRFM